MDKFIDRYIFWADSFLSGIYFLFVSFFIHVTNLYIKMITYISAENYVTCVLPSYNKSML